MRERPPSLSELPALIEKTLREGLQETTRAAIAAAHDIAKAKLVAEQHGIDLAKMKVKGPPKFKAVRSLQSLDLVATIWFRNPSWCSLTPGMPTDSKRGIPGTLAAWQML